MPSTSPVVKSAPITPISDRSDAPIGRRPVHNLPLGMPAPQRLVVGIVAAYPSMRAGLGALVQSDLNLTASAIAPAALAAASGLPALGQISDADVILIDPGDLPQDTLANLVTMGRQEDVPLLWLGFPRIAQQCAFQPIRRRGHLSRRRGRGSGICYPRSA